MKTLDQNKLKTLKSIEFYNGICLSCKNKIKFNHKKNCFIPKIICELKEKVREQQEEEIRQKNFHKECKKLWHHKDHGIKVGDTVKVIRRVGGVGRDNHEVINGGRYNWHNTWNGAMTHMLEYEQIQKVEEIHSYANEIGLLSDNGCIYYFPSSAVRRIKKA